MIVLTSDHGDYLGDHWLGEKDLFHDASAKIPMIIYDPRPAADPTRAARPATRSWNPLIWPQPLSTPQAENCRRISLRAESLIPWLHGNRPDWRSFAISEYDYSATPQAVKLGLEPRDARLFMVFDGRFQTDACRRWLSPDAV